MGYFASLDSIPKDIESASIGVKFNTVEFNFDSFLKKIEDGSIYDTKIQAIILYSLTTYLDYDNFTSPNTREIFQKLWTNDKFLTNLLKVLRDPKNKEDLKSIKGFHITGVNKIVYDYFCLHSTELETNRTLELLLQVVTEIDKDYISVLSTEIGEQAALYLTMAAKCSFKADVCVTELNRYITKLGYQFTIQNIIFIYSKFYSKGFSTLFNYTMTTIYPDQSREEEDMTTNINLALLYIMENMPSDEITTVLKQYSTYITLMQKAKVRFSLQHLTNFPRISSIVEILDNDIFI